MTEHEQAADVLADMYRQFRISDPRPGALDSPLHAGFRREVRAVEAVAARDPQARTRAQDDRVELALRDWPTYVACQVKKAERVAWATPTAELLARRLEISEARVRQSLKRRGLTLPAAPDPFAGWGE
ncbi:hypothetical protein [Deinococcus petrolearius]|uniref:Uncharacterized protein n=1 Tax=Deinococcus petrolearius TaxID=1751295 RepID=A0ABW1DD81_9DEIO